MDERIGAKRKELKKIHQNVEKEKRELEETRKAAGESQGRLRTLGQRMTSMADGVEKLTGKRVIKREFPDDGDLEKQIETKRKVKDGVGWKNWGGMGKGLAKGGPFFSIFLTSLLL